MQEFEQYDNVFRIVIIGNSSVGKSHIMHTFTKQKKATNIIPTIGVEYSSKTITLSANKKVKAQIWDTTGQQQYRSLTNNHLKRALGALIVFDITNRKSFEDVKYWMDKLYENVSQNVQLVLVGHKSDLSPSRTVSKEEAEQFAKYNGFLYYETTINSLESLKVVFHKLIQNIDVSRGNQIDQNEEKLNNNSKLKSQPKENSDNGCKC